MREERREMNRKEREMNGKDKNGKERKRIGIHDWYIVGAAYYIV